MEIAKSEQSRWRFTFVCWGGGVRILQLHLTQDQLRIWLQSQLTSPERKGKDGSQCVSSAASPGLACCFGHVLFLVDCAADVTSLGTQLSRDILLQHIQLANVSSPGINGGGTTTVSVFTEPLACWRE